MTNTVRFVEVLHDIHRASVRFLQANYTPGIHLSLCMGHSRIHGVKIFLNDDHAPTQTRLIWAVVPTIEFRTKEIMLRKSNYSLRRHLMRKDRRGVLLVDWDDRVFTEHFAEAADHNTSARWIILMNCSNEEKPLLVIRERVQPFWDIDGVTDVTKEVHTS